MVCLRNICINTLHKADDDDDDDDNDDDDDDNNNNKLVETILDGRVTISWNQHEQIDRTIPNNKSNIIIRNNEMGSCMLTV